MAVLSVGLLATTTPAAAQTGTDVYTKSFWRDKAMTAHLTDCPADAASRPGLQCALWIVIAAKSRETEDGVLVNKYPFLDVTKYRIRVVPGGYEATYAADGWEYPIGTLSLRFGADLSTATLTGTVGMTFYGDWSCDPIGTCVYKLMPISVKLRAVGPLYTSVERDHWWLDQCKMISHWGDSYRLAQGTAKIGGVSLVTTDAIVSPDLPDLGGTFIEHVASGSIQKGVCDSSPTFITA
jgi:hypothetical protein